MQIISNSAYTRKRYPGKTRLYRQLDLFEPDLELSSMSVFVVNG
jgi:hypothetical protein